MTPSYTDCSHGDVAKAARKLGFVLYEGKNHTKAKLEDGTFVTTIPRHPTVKKPTVHSIVKALKKHGCSQRDIDKVLRC